MILIQCKQIWALKLALAPVWFSNKSGIGAFQPCLFYRNFFLAKAEDTRCSSLLVKALLIHHYYVFFYEAFVFYHITGCSAFFYWKAYTRTITCTSVSLGCTRVLHEIELQRKHRVSFHEQRLTCTAGETQKHDDLNKQLSLHMYHETKITGLDCQKLTRQAFKLDIGTKRPLRASYCFTGNAPWRETFKRKWSRTRYKGAMRIGYKIQMAILSWVNLLPTLTSFLRKPEEVVYLCATGVPYAGPMKHAIIKQKLDTC